MTEQLSTAGRARRDAMLPGLVDDMRRVHRARRRRRATVATLSLTAALVVTAIALVPATPTENGEQLIAREPPVVELAPPAARAVMTVAFVTTDRGIADRLASTARSRVVELDDDTLVTALADIGRPAGLIRRDGRVELTRNVVDPPG